MMSDTRSGLTAEFSISYEGDALAQHTMPVRDLAPALLALGQAFDRANELLNGDRASVSLEIRATQPGSFQVMLDLRQLLEQAASALSPDFLSDATDLKNLLLGGTGLIGVIKYFKGRKPKEVSRTGGFVTLELEKLRLEVPLSVFALHKDRHLRENIEAVIRPVTKPGVDRVVFRQRNEVTQTVEKSDAECFSQDGEGPATSSEIIIPRQRLRVVSPDFEKGKWRLHDGDTTHHYEIADKDFVQEVEQGSRSFRRGDVLVCQVVLTQHIDDQGGPTRLKYRVSAVLKHVTKVTTLPLTGIESEGAPDSS